MISRPLLRSIPLPALLVAAASLLPAQEITDFPDFPRRTPVVQAAETVGPAVVNIRTKAFARRQHLFFDLFQQPDEQMLLDRCLGSGLIVHADGYVVTNEHVVHGADRITVTLQGGREVAAERLSFDQENDLAVLKLAGPGPYPAVRLEPRDDLMVGETTIALGNPFGLSSSATTGILSAIGRAVRFRGRAHFEDFIQTSALINPGNSGGPLLDINGRVIGVNVAIDSRGQGISFAIPVNRVIEVLEALINPTLVRNAWIGIEVRDGLGGLEIARIIPGSPAAGRDLHAGDKVRSVDGSATGRTLDYSVALLRHRAGDTVKLALERDGEIRTHTLRFETIPIDKMVRGSLKIHGMICAEVTPTLSRRLELPSELRGVVIVGVEPKSLADQIGLAPGDVIFQVERHGIGDAAFLARCLSYYARSSGGTARIRVYRPRTGEVLRGKLIFE